MGVIKHFKNIGNGARESNNTTGQRAEKIERGEAFLFSYDRLPRYVSTPEQCWRNGFMRVPGTAIGAGRSFSQISIPKSHVRTLATLIVPTVGAPKDTRGKIKGNPHRFVMRRTHQCLSKR